LETLMTSWSKKKGPLQPNEGDETRRETGFAMLAAAFRSAAAQAERQSSELDGWMPRTDAVVAR
jgi:hypothetical protein